jgi:hypothetical protein
MKKLMLLLFASSLIGLNSCEKSTSDNPGQIDGMGASTGKLQVKEPFKIPDGIHIVGDITGIENPVSKSGVLKSVDFSKSTSSYYGSGLYVKLKVTLLNSTNIPRTIFFPKGLLWECKDRSSQHGLQCQTTWVSLSPNTSRTILIDLYCANNPLPAPGLTVTYNILGVTSSKTVWNLLNLIGWRTVNYEMIFHSKGVQEGPTYEEITERLQLMVHNLTDFGIDLSAEDIAFIESIPELATEEIPVVDANSQFPEYFEEFIVQKK